MGADEVLADVVEAAHPAGEEVAEELDERGIELLPGVVSELVDRGHVADGRLVGSVVHHRVVGVGDGHDPRAERDVLAAQAIG